MLKKLIEAQTAFNAAHKFDAKFAGASLTGEVFRQGSTRFPVAGAKADFEHGANVGSRVTVTRVAVVGIFALGWKKSKNKVYVLVEGPNGEQVLIEAPAKDEREAREFANRLNSASAAALARQSGL